MAFISQDENMIKAFQEGRDIYATIAAIAFGKSYEECLEFTPTGEYNPDGKARRTEAKSVVLGKPIGFSDYNKKNAHLTGTSILRPLGINFVNPITQGCAA